MRHPFRFVVTPVGGKYNVEQQTETGMYIKTTSFEEAKDVNRLAKVIAVPHHYKGEIKEGDLVILHHNIFRDRNTQDGRFAFSSKHIEEDLFLADPDLIFLYYRDGDWNAHFNVCFVKPKEIEKNGKKAFAPLRGYIAFSNMLPKGTEIGFTPDSEYEFVIDGELYYKMSNSDIALLYEEPEWGHTNSS